MFTLLSIVLVWYSYCVSTKTHRDRLLDKFGCIRSYPWELVWLKSTHLRFRSCRRRFSGPFEEEFQLSDFWLPPCGTFWAARRSYQVRSYRKPRFASVWETKTENPDCPRMHLTLNIRVSSILTILFSLLFFFFAFR